MDNVIKSDIENLLSHCQLSSINCLGLKSKGMTYRLRHHIETGQGSRYQTVLFHTELEPVKPGSIFLKTKVIIDYMD